MCVLGAGCQALQQVKGHSCLCPEFSFQDTLDGGRELTLESCLLTTRPSPNPQWNKKNGFKDVCKMPQTEPAAW